MGENKLEIKGSVPRRNCMVCNGAMEARMISAHDSLVDVEYRCIKRGCAKEGIVVRESVRPEKTSE